MGIKTFLIERGKEMRNLSRTQTRDASFLLPKSVKTLQKNPISMPLLKNIFLLKVKSQTQNLHRIPFLSFIDNFAASLSSSSKSQPVTDYVHENEKKEDAANISLLGKRSQETESSQEHPSYSPAKTSHVAKITSKQVIKIRNINDELLTNVGEKQETVSSVKKIDFERLEDQEETNSALKFKKILDRDVKVAVEKCLLRFQKTKAILPGEEFRELVNMFVPDFTEKIRSTYLQTHPTENEIAITSADKQYIIDQIILYINLKDSINDYISPMELKIHLQLKLNQKGFTVLKKELVNELFTFLREVNQELQNLREVM